MNIGVLTEDLLLEVLKRLPPEDAAAAACVCRNWHGPSSSNVVWLRHLSAIPLLKVDVEAVAMRGPRACRDYWLMKHWLRNALLIVTWRARTKHVREARGVADRVAERRGHRAKQRTLQEQWRATTGSPPTCRSDLQIAGM